MLKHTTAIGSFLDSMSFETKRREHAAKTSVAFPFVTISRQVAAGGHTLADAVLAEMNEHDDEPLLEGWQLFDQQLCQVVADDPKLKVTLSSLVEESVPSPIEELLKESLLGRAPQEVVHRRIFEIIHSVASLGKVIILGRGAFCLTRGMRGGVHVRLVAPLELRIKRFQQLRNIDSENEARARLNKRDESRRKLVRAHFGQDIDNPLLYDAVFNTDSLDIVEIAHAVVGLIRRQTLC